VARSPRLLPGPIRSTGWGRCMHRRRDGRISGCRCCRWDRAHEHAERSLGGVPVEPGQSVAKVEVVTEVEVGGSLGLRGALHSAHLCATVIQIETPPNL
jgi:hypothetical protein